MSLKKKEFKETSSSMKYVKLKAANCVISVQWGFICCYCFLCKRKSASWFVAVFRFYFEVVVREVGILSISIVKYKYN